MDIVCDVIIVGGKGAVLVRSEYWIRLVMRVRKIIISLLGCWLLVVVPAAFAQDERARPSWSEEVKKTEVPDAPAAQDRPEMEFSIDRSALQGDIPTFQRTPIRKSIPVRELDTAAVAEPEFAAENHQQPVAAAPDPRPAAVVSARTIESEPVDERLVSLSRTLEPVAQDNSPASIANRENGIFKLVRTKTPGPEYPRQALLDQLEGWVDLLVTVDSNGKVEGVQVVAAEPRRVFERAAIRAARKWQFVPPIDSGLSDSQQGTFRVDFVMN